MRNKSDEKLKAWINQNTGLDFGCVYRSRRKSVSIEISETGVLVLRLPLSISKRFVLDFVRSKEDWILKKIDSVQDILASSPKLVFDENAKFLYLGKEYLLFFVDKDFSVLMFEDAFLLSEKLRHKAEKSFRKWYRLQAERLFSERIDHWSDRMGLRIKSWRLTNARRSWGSCSQDRSIRINWRLIMMPVEIIDYIIVHELAHIQYMNHSRKYWDFVGQFIADYNERRKWLKGNGAVLGVW